MRDNDGSRWRRTVTLLEAIAIDWALLTVAWLMAEFLLLAVACVALIVAALKKEAAENKSSAEKKGDEK